MLGYYQTEGEYCFIHLLRNSRSLRHINYVIAKKFAWLGPDIVFPYKTNVD